MIKGLGKVYNVISIIYIFFFFVYFVVFYVWKCENYVKENVVLLGIIIVNLCIWLDIFFLELDFLFKKYLDSNSFILIFNKIDFLNRVIEVIEKIDLFLFFVMIEFLLMVIDLFFIKMDDFLEGFILNDLRDAENDVRLDYMEDRNIFIYNEGNEWKDFFKVVF